MSCEHYAWTCLVWNIWLYWKCPLYFLKPDFTNFKNLCLWWSSQVCSTEKNGSLLIPNPLHMLFHQMRGEGCPIFFANPPPLPFDEEISGSTRYAASIMCFQWEIKQMGTFSLGKCLKYILQITFGAPRPFFSFWQVTTKLLLRTSFIQQLAWYVNYMHLLMNSASICYTLEDWLMKWHLSGLERQVQMQWMKSCRQTH